MRAFKDSDQVLVDRILSLIKSGDNSWKQEIVNCDELIYSHVLSWLRKLNQRDEAFYIAKTGDELGYLDCTSRLAEFYLSEFGCVLDPCLGARLLVKSTDRVLLEIRLFNIGWTPMYRSELYVYGQCLPLIKTWRENWSELCVERFASHLHKYCKQNTIICFVLTLVPNLIKVVFQGCC